MIAYLVINKKTLLPYAEQYKVFLDPAAAMQHAINCGFESISGPPKFNSKVGVMSIYQCGDVNVSFMPIEIVEAVSQTAAIVPP